MTSASDLTPQLIPRAPLPLVQPHRGRSSRPSNAVAGNHAIVPTPASPILPSMSAQPTPPDPAAHHDPVPIHPRHAFEVSNYFSGSPLNRVAFLRSDHSFLSHALRHPSASFLLFNDLAPFTKSPSTLAYASYTDVKPFIGEDPFAKSEEDMLRGFSSDITVPLVLFLGLDEKKDGGVEWGAYKGTPHFAADATPRGTLKEKAEALIGEMEGRGWKLLRGRVNFLDAPQGILENSDSPYGQALR